MQMVVVVVVVVVDGVSWKREWLFTAKVRIDSSTERCFFHLLRKYLQCA